MLKWSFVTLVCGTDINSPINLWGIFSMWVEKSWDSTCLKCLPRGIWPVFHVKNTENERTIDGLD
jgi:hypothetical protein